MDIRIASVLGLAVLAGTARAGCPVVDLDTLPGATPGPGQVVSVPGRATLVPVSLAAEGSVVGLWKFEMFAKSTATNTNPMPDGTLIDFGTAAWHSDGTELMNSGIRNPADGDFCQGVWRQVGPSTYALNHFALAYAGGNYVGPANIRERVVVSGNGSQFSGGFVLTQYLASTVPGHEFDQTTALVTITGTVRATRVTAD